MTAFTRPLAALGSACVAGLLLIAWAPPAGAASAGGLTVTLGQRWKVAGRIGAWTPYTVTVRYEGPGTFSGDVFLIPNTTRSGPFPADFPQYRSPLTVSSGTERTAQVYVIEEPGGYHAELRDGQGRVVATAAPNFALPTGAAIAILSDLPQAEQRISAPLKSLSRIEVGISQFSSAHAFPNSVVHLSALNGLVIDQFDSGALDHAQVQTLKDFVGLGGTLIVVGGSSWRRTLTPLAQDLLPLRPAATATASLATLAEMAGLASTTAVEVVTGDVASWAKVAVASPEGQPLIVEGAYGAGRVLALTFDPLAEPVDGQLALAALSWSQAISRGLSGAQGGSQLAGAGFGGPVQPSTLGASGPGTWSAFPGYLTQILNDTPAASSPALGLLAALLIGYGLLASLFSYILLKAIGRRGLLWVIVPALAVAFTAGSYLIGFGTRSLDYQLTGVQVQRLGPEGLVETYGLGAVLSPRRGDVRVDAAPNTLVSTAMPLFGPPNTGALESLITVAPRPEVLFTNVAVWEQRPVQTLTITHSFAAEPVQDMGITAQLRLEQGRIKGQVTNHTSRTVRELQLVSASGTGAQLAATLAPGATARIDQAVTQATPGLPPAKNVVIMQGGGVVGSGPVYPQNSRQALIALGASQALGRAGDLALVGLTDPVDTLHVGGGHAASSTRAVVVEPVRLQSADSLAGIAPQARLVGDRSDGAGTLLDVYELDLPGGVTGRIGLSVAFLKSPVTTPYPVEVYDWDLRAWHSLSLQPTAAPLTPGETAGGVVRVRVREDRPGQAVLTATSIP